MILGSHNSWSYAKPKKWYMYPFRFIAQCQERDIAAQYMIYNVRFFDLRVKFDSDGKPIIAHGKIVYDIDEKKLFEDLSYLNEKGDCSIRLVHEVRTKKEHEDQVELLRFMEFCDSVLNLFPNIRFFNGSNLYNHAKDYELESEPTCDEKYSSVCPPKYLDDWFPRIYAVLNNRKNKKKATDKEVLLIDFVNIG